MTMVLFVMGIRLCLYSFLTNPWWVLPIEFLQGMTFGICYSAMAMYANVVAPNGTAATLQVCLSQKFNTSVHSTDQHEMR